jgi:hypothetical protein
MGLSKIEIAPEQDFPCSLLSGSSRLLRTIENGLRTMRRPF